MAGFLWKIPEYLTEAYSNKIINIHPALLPKFGGKGMYGINIHKKVIEQRYFNELSYKEISKKLKQPINNVKVRIMRAKRILAEMIEKS